MISIVTYKWQQPGSPRMFSSEHVNVLYAMVTRHYPRPFRFICVTDDAAGLDEGIESIPLPVRFDDVPSPQGLRFPSCYCRLWNFSKEAQRLGERILSLDLDCVILDDLRPLVDREEDFVGWCDERSDGGSRIAGGIYLLRTGSMTQVWDNFYPQTSPAEHSTAGFRGSDQGWMSFQLSAEIGFPRIWKLGKWTKADGLTKINWTPEGATKPPKGARIVFTSGAKPPWSKETQLKYPWVREIWK